MLRGAAFLALADFRHAMRRRETWVWAFFLPAVFFYFIGTITANMSGSGPPPELAVLVEPGAGELTDRFVDLLEKSGYRVSRETKRAKWAAYPRRLTIPTGFSAALASGQPVALNLVRDQPGIQADYDRTRIQRAAIEAAVGARSGRRAEELPLTLETKAAGARKRIPSGFEQAIPGSMVFFILMVLLATSAATLVAERERGILRRLASSPMTREAVVVGKWGARMLLACVQIAFSMLAGVVLFHVSWGAHLPMVLLVLLAYAAFAAAAGVLIGSLARTRTQAGAGGSVLANALACLGGCWWPVEIMPHPMQVFASFTPPGMAMGALHQLVNFGAEPAVALPELAALSALAVAAGWLAARSFRFQ